MKIFSHRAYYYTKMFHGEQKCVFLCRWHTKYVLHKSRWGSASNTLFNIVTRQVHNCDLHENIQLRPACKYSTATCMKYFTSGAANIQLRPACKYSTATSMQIFSRRARYFISFPRENVCLRNCAFYCDEM